MSDYNDGKWHGWNGGKCPVHPKSRVQVSLRACCPTGLAGSWDWNFKTDPIVAFRVLEKYKEPQEPKVLWVNEYENEIRVYLTEEEARRACRVADAIGIAVKYVEFQDE